MQTIVSFVDECRAKAKGKVKSAIVERWNMRVVPRNLHAQGRNGARAYLDSYGKGIAVPKVVELALCAEMMGAQEMADGFWEAAYHLLAGNSESLTSAPGVHQPVVARASTPTVTLKGLPSSLQPERIAPMQPKDAPMGVSHYIVNPEYQAQPKRDGHKDFLFATENEAAHQSRSTSIMGMITPAFEEATKAAAKDAGPFILEGERYYLSATGSEHRTAAQAATANIAAGCGDAAPIPVYGAFHAIFANGCDLRDSTEDVRVAKAEVLVALIHSYLPEGGARVEAVPTARTTEEKRQLVEKQQTEGREGVVWTMRDARYAAGNQTVITARTKFVEEKEFTVVAATPSTAAGRALASLDVADDNGTPVGSIGSGWDNQTGEKILRLHQNNPGSVRVVVRHQGFTEAGKLWLPRLLEVC